jgi:hypothetical protein
MIRESFAAVGNAVRDTLKNPIAVGVFAVLYLLFLVACYMFISTGVGTVFQLGLTGIAVVAAPLLFMILQAAGAKFATGESSAGQVIKNGVKDFWKVLLISIPLIGLVVLSAYLFAKLQNYFAASAPSHPLVPTGPSRIAAPTQLRWQEVLLTSIRLLVFGIFLPLLSMHLWLSVARSGLLGALKNFFGLIGKAFGGRSVLIYSIGLVIFGVVPYFLLFTRTPVKNGWLELFIFGVRLLLVFLFTLIGWLVTFRALNSLYGPPDAGVVTAGPPMAPAQAA